MNKKILISALIAMFVSSGTPAFAQEHEHGNDNGRGQNMQEHRDQGGHDEHNHGNDGAKQATHGNARNDHGNYQVANHAPDDRGAGPRHDMRKGNRLPKEYRGRQYEVSDWRGHHLSQPPRGYHWVQTGGDYVLVAITTGIIMQILLNQ